MQAVNTLIVNAPHDLIWRIASADGTVETADLVETDVDVTVTATIAFTYEDKEQRQYTARLFCTNTKHYGGVLEHKRGKSTVTVTYTHQGEID